MGADAASDALRESANTAALLAIEATPPRSMAVLVRMRFAVMTLCFGEGRKIPPQKTQLSGLRFQRGK